MKKIQLKLISPLFEVDADLTLIHTFQQQHQREETCIELSLVFTFIASLKKSLFYLY